MELATPAALVLAFLAVPLALAAGRTRTRGFAIAGGAGITRARPTLRLRLARLLPVLRIGAVLLLVVAAAGPRAPKANAAVPARGIDIALSVDISSSMTTSSFGTAKSRLEATKQVLRDFIKGRTGDRIGLVVFQQDAMPLAPPSLDYRALDQLVAGLQSGLLTDGTGIGVGLASALNMLRESTAASRVVILLTDGQHNAASIKPLDAAQIASALHIRVYTIGLIDNGPRGSGDVDQKLLQSMADMTGGKFFSADNPQALASVYDEISKLETTPVERDNYERFTEYGPWLSAAAAALLAIELALGATWLRRSPA